MRGKTWQAKSCQTALASWAQMRHTTALQTKSHVGFMNGDSRTVLGFIEPNPEFYRRLAALSARIQGGLKRVDISAASVAQRLDRLTRRAAAVSAFFESRRPGILRSFPKKMSEADREYYREVACEMLQVVPSHLIAHRKEFSPTESWLAPLVHLQNKLEKDDFPADGPWAAIAKRISMPTDDLWTKIINLAHQLAKFSERRLAGSPIDAEENAFLGRYADALSELHSYGYHAGSEPRDDALRTVPIFASPPLGVWLHAAVGRPRAIYVLYPYQGEEIVCRGAVLPYYEFTQPQPMTDSEWRKLYDSAQRPRLLAWTSGLYAK
jgi:hypothetical protein